MGFFDGVAGFFVRVSIGSLMLARAVECDFAGGAS